jgi:Flp pilus assembly protein TadB
MKPPFFIPKKVASFISRPLSRFSDYFSKMFPRLGSSLKISGIDIDEVKYIRISILNALVIGICFGLLFFMGSVRFNAEEYIQLWGSVVVGFVFFILYFSYLMLFPIWTISRAADQIDKHLLFAVRHLVVQTSAGVPLFDALSSASTGYGKVSEEFSRIITEVNGGKDLAETLEKSAQDSPSSYYRRIMWQIANSSKAGYATADILNDLLGYLTSDQMSKLKKFGSELNILSIFYLSTCIILPTFGLIFVIIMSSFSIIMPNTTTLSLILFFVTLFNLVFLGMIKSRRPAGIL